eukprot:602759-Hanusia_phi.AAC.3
MPDELGAGASDMARRRDRPTALLRRLSTDRGWAVDTSVPGGESCAVRDPGHRSCDVRSCCDQGDCTERGYRKRSEAELRKKGLLKWGIGKLIAHLPKKPVFVPFYHIGMTAVLPQHNRWEKGIYNNLVVSWDPRNYGRGCKIKVNSARVSCAARRE